MPTETTRESIIFSFNTHIGRVRLLSVPNPMANVTMAQINSGAQDIIDSNAFNENHGTGRPVSTRRIVRERVVTKVLF